MKKAAPRPTPRELLLKGLEKLPAGSYAAVFALAWFDRFERRDELWYLPTGNLIEDAEKLAELVHEYGSSRFDAGEKDGLEAGRQEGERFATNEMLSKLPPEPETAIERADLEYRRKFPWRVAELSS